MGIHSSLYLRVASDGEKKFYDIETRISWMLKKKPEKKSKW
jgi:hypothetical protein